MVQVELQGKLCSLKGWSESDIETLYKWRNSKLYLEFCTLRKFSNSLEDFKGEFYQDMKTDRQDQHMIIRKKDGKPVGTIFLYGLNTFHGNGFITTFIEEDSLNMGYGVEAFALFCSFVFQKYGLHKIIADVYSNNLGSLKMLLACGFLQEGHFKEHRKNNRGEWLDVLRLSLFFKNLSRLEAFVKKIAKI